MFGKQSWGKLVLFYSRWFFISRLWCPYCHVLIGYLHNNVSQATMTEALLLMTSALDTKGYVQSIDTRNTLFIEELWTEYNFFSINLNKSFACPNHCKQPTRGAFRSEQQRTPLQWESDNHCIFRQSTLLTIQNYTYKFSVPEGSHCCPPLRISLNLFRVKL